MTRYYSLFAILLTLCWGSLLHSQEPINGLMRLLREPSVHEDFQLTADQVKKLPQFRVSVYKQNFLSLIPFQDKEAIEVARAEWNALVDKALVEFMSADKLKRLKQIDLQVRASNGYGLVKVLTEPQVIKELDLQEQQKAAIAEVRQITRTESPRLSMEDRTTGRTDYRKKLAALRQDLNERLLKSFSPSQLTKWKEMIGSEFKGEIDFDKDLYPGN